MSTPDRFWLLRDGVITSALLHDNPAHEGAVEYLRVEDIQEKLRYLEMLEEMTTEECDGVHVFHADPEPETNDRFWAVDACGGWTDHREVRFWGPTRYEALANAYSQWQQGFVDDVNPLTMVIPEDDGNEH